MVEMKTLTINGNKYEVVDEYAREHGGSGSSEINDNFTYRGVTLDDVTKNEMWFGLGDADCAVGATFNENDKHSLTSDHCKFKTTVNIGDMILFTKAHTLTNSSDGEYILVIDENNVILERVSYDEIRNNSKYFFEATDYERTGGVYVFEHSGTLCMSFKYTDVTVGEFFYIKTPHPEEPLVLYEHVSYEEDTTYGDAVLEAIMEGRQVLVRIDNVDGGKYTALYSPIYQYQLPNYMNNYLYLFYLKDNKQTLDLSAMGMGTIELPVYGEIKLKLSKDYNQSPLV